MKLGIFDSGLGGLAIARAVRRHIPDIDILYLGDTRHVPYGNRSKETIYTYTQRCMDYLFRQDCKLVVIACNTASASALRQLQQEWLPRHWPDRNILGVIVPTVEAAIAGGYKKIGLIATHHTVSTGVYAEELGKIDPAIRLFAQPTPLLVPLIENDGMKWVDGVLRDYLPPLLAENIECLILGCTHYACLKDIVRPIVGADVAILSQDDIIPARLADYLRRHPEYSDSIDRTGKTEFRVSDLTDSYRRASVAVYGENITIEKAVIAA